MLTCVFLHVDMRFSTCYTPNMHVCQKYMSTSMASFVRIPICMSNKDRMSTCKNCMLTCKNGMSICIFSQHACPRKIACQHAAPFPDACVDIMMLDSPDTSAPMLMLGCKLTPLPQRALTSRSNVAAFKAFVSTSAKFMSVEVCFTLNDLGTRQCQMPAKHTDRVTVADIEPHYSE